MPHDQMAVRVGTVRGSVLVPCLLESGGFCYGTFISIKTNEKGSPLCVTGEMGTLVGKEETRGCPVPFRSSPRGSRRDEHGKGATRGHGTPRAAEEGGEALALVCPSGHGPCTGPFRTQGTGGSPVASCAVTVLSSHEDPPPRLVSPCGHVCWASGACWNTSPSLGNLQAFETCLPKQKTLPQTSLPLGHSVTAREQSRRW